MIEQEQHGYISQSLKKPDTQEYIYTVLPLVCKVLENAN